MKREFALFIRYFLTLVLKSLKTIEFLAPEGNEWKTLEALSWKVPESDSDQVFLLDQKGHDRFEPQRMI